MKVERTIILPGNKPETIAQVFTKAGSGGVPRCVGI
jgi:hypothetical protein